MSILLERKCCATCTWWGGDRRVLSSGIGVECKSGSEKGMCGNPKRSSRKEEQCGYNCSHHYEKWSPLTKLKG